MKKVRVSPIKQAARIDVISPKHTHLVAKMLAEMLSHYNIACCIHDEDFSDFESIPYILVCAQTVKILPECYICFQLEQTINERWMTEEYFRILRGAPAILDYSFVNISYFSQFEELEGKLFYVPVGLAEKKAAKRDVQLPQKYDVLFYGELNCKRKSVISKLQNEFRIEVETNLYGREMLEKIKQSKVVINIHYYENALLETTRLTEVLSLGCSVIVSERSNDTREEARFEDLVDFVEADDIESLKEHIRFWLTHEEERQKKLEYNRTVLWEKLGDVPLYFERFLLSVGALPSEQQCSALAKCCHIPSCAFHPPADNVVLEQEE